MIIHNWNAQYENRRVKHVVLIFGLGLIGRAVQRAIRNCFIPSSEELPFNWDSNSIQQQQIIEIQKRVTKLGSNQSCPVQIDIVWSAGKAGFGAGEPVFQKEAEAFSLSLNLAKSITRELPHCKLRYHLLSTAGGLYEGQILVDADSHASIHRSYGQAKLQLESSLAALPEQIEQLIYRPSSVYGYGGPGARIGLVVAAIHSAVKNSLINIYAKPDTLRDYVYVEDIGRFIASNIEKTIFDKKVFILASGKPTSTVELTNIIERVTEKRLLIQYQLAGDNTMSNTYQSTCLPNDWEATSLETGVFLTAMKIKSEFIQNYST